ncbi:hypothetical protein P3S68_030140 [Capsicum galapagoense]
MILTIHIKERGQRTNWVMQEYRLIDEELQRAGIPQLWDAFVLCRVFQKSGAGPKNGEQYEAPVIDEEWEEDELQLLPKDEAAEEFIFGDDVYLDANELDQLFLEQAQLWRLFLWKPPCFDVSGGVFFSGIVLLDNGAQVICDELDIFS